MTAPETGSLKIPVLMLWPLYSTRRGRATFSEISFNRSPNPGELPFVYRTWMRSVWRRCRSAATAFQLWEIPLLEVCPNPPHFYKIKGLLPALRSRKQVPSEALLKSHHYENS